MSEHIDRAGINKSPYWIGRHKRAFWSGLAALGIASTGLFAWLSNTQAQDTAEAGAKALRQDRACERVIDQKAGSNVDKAALRLSSLSMQQQVDCRVDNIASTKNVGRGYGEPRLPVRVIDATVQLPSRQELEAAQVQDLKESKTSQWDELPVDIGMGMIAVPVIAFLFTAVGSGDYTRFSRRY